MATPTQPGKQMSSRLLTMKFMQRAANSPSSDNPSSASGPPSKKQRLSNGSSYSSSPSNTPVKPTSKSRHQDRQAVQAALVEEERRRQHALEKAAADAGESRWVLSFQEDTQSTAKDGNGGNAGLQIIRKSYAEIDLEQRAVDESFHSTKSGGDDHPKAHDSKIDLDRDAVEGASSLDLGDMVGRRSFGRFNQSIERRQDPKYESSSNSEAPSDSFSASEDSENEETRTQSHAERKASNKHSKAVPPMHAEDRRNKNISLNRLSTISGGGGSDPRKNNVECFKCGQKGHRAKHCHQPNRTKGRGNNGPGFRGRERG
ncbi:MAG: hypothetical protein M1821_005800 [Bathelium mastoideum]|nr:MAG: hypothetical protein M1821_005800 [Bathelium mastoideum]KAI9681727.1 MAG: hypothetical protein M1822_007079 [Bathelium mastoideum]